VLRVKILCLVPIGTLEGLNNMDIIKTGLDISKTIRNVGRLKEILVVFAKNGFEEFVTQAIPSKIPNFVLPKSKKKIRDELKETEEKNWGKILALRLRISFEELGPTFIKFGQLLASREDLFPSDFIEELSKLKDRVKGIPFSKIRSHVEESFGKSIDEIFSEVEEKPIGTASIAVVYRAKLLTGERVVLKVKRPNIEKEIERDIALMQFLALHLEKRSEELKYLGISRVFHDFSIGIRSELNFNMEGLNGARFKAIIEKYDEKNIFYIPKIYKQFSGENILVMEYIDGIKFTDRKQIDEIKKKISPNVEIVLKIILKTLLQDGFFHADLHAGNFILKSDGKIALIDFGLMGRLGVKERINFISIVHAILSYNFESIVYEFLDVAEYDIIPDVDRLIGDVKESLTPFIGLTVKETDIPRVLKTIIKTLKTHKLYLPRDWYIVFRSFITLDGSGKSLGLDFDLYNMLEKDIQYLIKDSLNKENLTDEALLIGKDIIQSLRVFPRHLKWFLREWSKKKYGIEIIHTGHEKSAEKVTNSIVFLGFAILSSVFLLSGVFFLGRDTIYNLNQVPLFSWIFFSFAVISFLVGYRKI
jgi:ubiquinone biosynthesis protein